jgi:hypothetical protein
LERLLQRTSGRNVERNYRIAHRIARSRNMLNPGTSSACNEPSLHRVASDSIIDENDVALALESLNSAAFRRRFIRTGCNAPDLEWHTPSGRPIHDHVREQMYEFKGEVEGIQVRDLRGGVFQRFNANSLVTIAQHHLHDLAPPTARDLLHVYGPDKYDTKDWSKYFRYAWKEKGPNAIIYSDDAQMIREGKLSCNSYAYSGQSSFALAGAGMFFIPEYGDAHISIRPYVQWLTSASFTGTERAPATASAFLGIYVESWSRAGGGYNLDMDHFINVWSQNTEGYMTNVANGGSASVGDGLATEVFAVTSRKYAIYVYAYLETSAAPQQHKNELRFVTLDIDATVPYVVVEEKLA